MGREEDGVAGLAGAGNGPQLYRPPSVYNTFWLKTKRPAAVGFSEDESCRRSTRETAPSGRVLS